MALDLAGKRLLELMERRDVQWLDPPNPTWRIQPPTLLGWLLGGFRASDYDTRFVKLLEEIVRAYPGAYITYALPPDGMRGVWKEAELAEPEWTEAETGTFKRDVERHGKAWVIPTDADAQQMARWLHLGAWSIWKPVDPKAGLPRHLAQSTYKTVRDCGFHFLVTSSWENQFTEISLNPELAAAAAAA